MTEDPEHLEADDEAVGDRLTRERPAPNPAFRGALGRHLAATDPGYGPRPERLWLSVSGYVAIGLVLILLGLLQATGAL
jgi:hypothetical protein